MLEIVEYSQNKESDTESDSDGSDWEPEESSDESSDYELPEKESLDDKTATNKKRKINDRKWMPGSFVPKTFDFDASQSGISSEVSSKINDSEVCPLSFFEFFFDQELMNKIVAETNIYNETIEKNEKSTTRKHQKAWTDVNVDEMYSFFALCMLMAAVKKGRIKDYWSTDHLIATPIFGEVMPRDRFLAIMKALHFNDNENQPAGDRLFKIQPVVHHMNRKFRSCINPYQNLCIDESLMPWKGRLVFKQYLPKKRHRFGVKIFVICDCTTGIVLGFIIYIGSETEIEDWKDLGISGSVVMTMMNSYMDKGHNLYVDNWYTGVKLFEELHKRDTGACGTIKNNRSGFPKFETLQKGESVYKHTENLLATKWKDKRDVHMLTSIQKDGLGSTGKLHHKTKEIIKKPLSVIAYNSNMGSVDKSDMQLSFVECIRKTIKWYKKFFFHLLDLSVLNSSILHQIKTGKKQSLGHFRNELVRGIIQKYCKDIGTRRLVTSGPHPKRLIDRHFPSLVPPKDRNKSRQRNCVVCSHSIKKEKKRSSTRYQCDECDVGLCVINCFKEYHTLFHF